jgi:DNA-binding CsgD family transcriptional regulator
VPGVTDPIRIVEAAYGLDDPDQRWLESLGKALRPSLDEGLGIGLFFFEIGPKNQLRFSKPVILGAGRAVAAALPIAMAATPRAIIGKTFGAPGWLATTSELILPGPAFANHPLTVMFGRPFGVGDLLTLKVMEPDRTGVGVVSALREIRTATPRERESWGMCVAHIRSALRLRRSLAGKDVLDGAEAVVTPSGKCVHADGEAKTRDARESLKDAVKRAERARGPLRKTRPDEALELWQALVSGRWSLVERFESDGQRYLVARPNPPELRDPRGLSARERQVVALAVLGHSHKLIAYELGISRSTASGYVSSAMRKLGVETQAELVGAVRARPVAQR